MKDVARWWQDYISGFLWTDDITSNFSYFRKDNNVSVYELKSILAHEFGHAMGMQHSDACFYNINTSTGQPWNANHRTAAGGTVVVQPTIGPELMNEIWVASSPGQKAPLSLGIDGYNRTPGRDDFEFMNYAYPFQQLSLEEVGSGTPVILIDSTDAAASGGQTTFQAQSNVVPGDDDQGWFLDQVNIWVGNNIGLRNRSQSWFIENYTGFNMVQITLRVNGTSTRRAISENAPPFFTWFDVGLTSSPEQLIFGWSTPLNGPWPPSASGWLTVNLDAHDWVLQEGLMWANSNQAFPLALPSMVPITPWGVVSPNAPPPAQAPGYVVAVNAPSEPTPEPDDIELLPPSVAPPLGGLRGFKLVVPQDNDVRFEQLQVLPLDWADAELMIRLSDDARNRRLARAFADRQADIVDFMPSHRDGGRSAHDLGLLPDATLFRNTRDGRRVQLPPLSAVMPLALGNDQTYAVRTVLSTASARVTALALPEMTTYLGTGLARCAQTGDPASCCPSEMADPIRIRTAHWSTRDLMQSRCILGSDSGERVQLAGPVPHLLATGAGDDRVHVSQAGSVVLLGSGNNEYIAAAKAGGHAIGGSGNDRMQGSAMADLLDGGAGDDTIFGHGGDDIILGGSGNDHINAGPGDDTIYPGSGRDLIFGGTGNDRVIYLNVCELEQPSTLYGGAGEDTLILPTSAEFARRKGLMWHGFERVVENATRASMIADCE